MQKIYVTETTNDWDNIPSSERQNKRKTHEIFKNLAKAENDSYWSDIYNEFSRGKFPKNLHFQHMELKYGKLSYALTDDPYVNIIGIREFLINTGLYINDDNIEEQQDEEEIVTERLWKNCDKLSKRELIRNYTFYLKDELSLNEQQRIKILNHINILINTCTIKCGDIQIENNSITYINGFNYKGKKDHFKIISDIKYNKKSNKIEDFPILIKRKPIVKTVVNG